MSAAGNGSLPEPPQRIIGKSLDDITPTEGEEAIELRDDRIARRVQAEGPKGGVL